MLFARVMTLQTSAYDEALERFHTTGPEFAGWLSNHGPMVVEALANQGRPEGIHRWVDGYLTRLDERPRGIEAIRSEEWREYLGDPVRTGDWIDFFTREVAQRPWREVLVQWWPRLLPGIAAGATHGVIRVGHAVEALGAIESQPRIDELAHGLAYWAARWLPVPVVPLAGVLQPEQAIAIIPAVPVQEFGIRSRIAQLDQTPGWGAQASQLQAPDTEHVPAVVDALIDAALGFYATHAHGNPTMLVHAATAPNAVRNVLPLLPRELWRPSLDAVWTATAAIVAAYRPSGAALPPPAPADADDLLDQAVAHGGEHVIKLADTAVRAHRRSASDTALSAGANGILLDA